AAKPSAPAGRARCVLSRRAFRQFQQRTPANHRRAGIRRPGVGVAIDAPPPESVAPSLLTRLPLRLRPLRPGWARARLHDVPRIGIRDDPYCIYPCINTKYTDPNPPEAGSSPCPPPPPPFLKPTPIGCRLPPTGGSSATRYC